jgi:hypothetical protein
MVRFYKILKKTIVIIAIIIKIAPASPTSTAATKGDYWKDRVTQKRDKQPQSILPLKWINAGERPSRLQVIKQRIKLITSHTKRKPPPIKLHTATINKRKNKRTKSNTKKHTKQKRRTLANFAIPKQKHSPQWLRMSLRIKNLSTKNFECNNHAKPSLQQSVNTTSNNIPNTLQPYATPKTNANPSTHATSPKNPITLDEYHPGGNIDDAKNHPNRCTWTHFDLAAVPQKWLRPTTIKDIAPPPYVCIMCTPPAPDFTPPTQTNQETPHHMVHKDGP